MASPKVVDTNLPKFLHKGVPPLKNREGKAVNLGESRLNLPANGLRSLKQQLCKNRVLCRNGAASSELPSWNSCARVFMMVFGHAPSRPRCRPQDLTASAQP